VRLTAERRGLRDRRPDHAAGQNQTLGKSDARLRKVEPLDDVDVIDHAQSETDDLFARHGNSPSGSQRQHPPMATAPTNRALLTGIDAIPLRFADF